MTHRENRENVSGPLKIILTNRSYDLPAASPLYKIAKIWLLSFVIGCGIINPVHGETDVPVTNTLARGLADLRYNLTRIEAESTNKVVDLVALAKQADSWVTNYPGLPEPLIWKGIIVSARAKHVGISALALVDEARVTLEKAIAIDPNACEAAGLNALGMLYHKVPSWPISFGSNKKARLYFEKAMATSSNLDTNFRMGEFLIDMGEKKKGLQHLRAALALPDRSRPEDVWKRKDIEALILKNKDAK
jgi:tetratricopeptide (TPR) repeat protein